MVRRRGIGILRRIQGGGRWEDDIVHSCDGRCWWKGQEAYYTSDGSMVAGRAVAVDNIRNNK